MRRYAVVAVASSLLALAACGGEEDDPVPIVRVADPVAAFAPVVRLHPDERRFPLSASRFLDHSTLEWSGGACPYEINVAAGPVSQRVTREGAPRLAPRRLGGERRPYTVRPRAADCRGRRSIAVSTDEHARPYDRDRGLPGVAAGEGFFLDFLQLGYGGTRRLARVPAYFERSPAEVDGQAGVRLTYWLLFGTSESFEPDGTLLSSHEGDWERFEVVLGRGDAPSSYRPAFARRFVDGRPRTVAWSDLRLAGAGGAGPPTHPMLFAARASHTLYPHPGRYRRAARSGYTGEADTALELAECGSCPRWETWRVLRPARDEPWYGFGGGWGVVGRYDVSSGPLGPSPFGR